MSLNEARDLMRTGGEREAGEMYEAEIRRLEDKLAQNRRQWLGLYWIGCALLLYIAIAAAMGWI